VRLVEITERLCSHTERAGDGSTVRVVEDNIDLTAIVDCEPGEVVEMTDGNVQFGGHQWWVVSRWNGRLILRREDYSRAGRVVATREGEQA
jgi:hypothetical protein